MSVVINIPDTATALQAPDLRKPRLNALLQVLVTPIVYVYNLFIAYRTAKLKERLIATRMELVKDIDSDVLDNSVCYKHCVVFDNNHINSAFVADNYSIHNILPTLITTPSFTSLVQDSYYDYSVYILGTEIDKLNIAKKYRFPTKTFFKTYWG